MSARERTATVGGHDVRYFVAGDGLPVLLLHGYGLGQHTYGGVAKRLVQQGCRVVAPGLPGFGGTPDLAESTLSFEGYARWLDRFLEAIGEDERVVVVGHSFGGGVAIRFAHDFPERVRSLVLVNSIGGSAWRSGRTLKAIAQRPLWDWGIHFPADIWPARQATKVLPVVLKDAIPNLLRNPRAFVRVGGLARRADLTAELEELKRRRLPVTVLWGNRDGVVTRESFEALCVAVGASGEVVDGSHSWLLADPKAFGEVITNHLEVAKLARLRPEVVETLEGDVDASPRRRRRKRTSDPDRDFRP